MAADESGEEIESGTIDRRTALRRGAVGAGVAGALWVAPSIVGHDAAFAGSSCAQKDKLDWTSYTAAGTFTSASFAAISSFPLLTLTKTFTTVGTGVVGLAPNNAVLAQTFGGQSAAYYQIQMNNTATGVGYDAKFTFSRQIFNLQFSLWDIDFTASSWKDVVWLSGTGLTGSPGFTSNTTGYSAPASFSGSGTVGVPWTGTAAAASTASNGNINVTMSTCTTFTLSFRSATPIGTSQRIGIGNLTWCR